MIWKPHVTVAAIAEREGRFLVVEERVRGQLVINNPAGHLEESESFQDAIRRETLEETGWEFEPETLTGIYLWKNQRLDTTFLRVTFFGSCIRHRPEQALDRGIVGPRWLTRDELNGGSHVLRSPMVVRCIDDYLAGHRYPLQLLTCFPRPGAGFDDA
ncbi:MAG TPA: NUDIX hydrolase [Gammaproteobacteria bacterium]|nr:NUDIX hydrolase [Gammaproteobacteria bacterium]